MKQEKMIKSNLKKLYANKNLHLVLNNEGSGNMIPQHLQIERKTSKPSRFPFFHYLEAGMDY